MSRETDAAADAQREVNFLQSNRAQREFLQKHLNDSIAEWAKAAIVLNSAAIATMLGFAQALVGKGQLTAFKPYVMGALMAFLFGVVMGAAVFGFRIVAVQMQMKATPDKRWTAASILAPAISVALFAIGAGAVIWGIAEAF